MQLWFSLLSLLPFDRNFRFKIYRPSKHFAPLMPALRLQSESWLRMTPVKLSQFALWRRPNWRATLTLRWCYAIDLNTPFDFVNRFGFPKIGIQNLEFKLQIFFGYHALHANFAFRILERSPTLSERVAADALKDSRLWGDRRWSR